MRTLLLLLLACSGLTLAAPASALPNEDAPALSGGQERQISLSGGSLDLSVLLSSGDLAKLLGAPAPPPGFAEALGQAIATWGGRFDPIFRSRWPNWRPPVPGTPTPAVPEPGAALVFATGLLLAARATRRRA